MSLRVFYATFVKELIVRIRAYPIDFMVGCITTAFYMDLGAWLLYECLFKKRLSDSFIQLTGSQDYMSYIIVGSVIFLFIQRTCLNVSRTLITELREGTLESLMLAPFHREAYFLGNMTLQVFTTTMEAACAVIIGLFFGLKIQPVDAISVISAILLSLYAMFGLSLILGFIMLYTRDTYITQNTLFAFIFLTCGITFPKEFLPGFLKDFTYLLPVADVSEVIRGTLLYHTPIVELRSSVFHLLIVSTIYLILGFPMMRLAEKRALEKMEG